MNKSLPRLEGARTVLRMATEDDIREIISYYTRNREYLAPFEPRRGKDFYTYSYWYEEIERRSYQFSSDRSLKLFLSKKDNLKKIVGSVNFSNFIRGSFQSCTLGYSLAEAEQGKGYMTEALKVAIAYTFKDLNLHRIMAAYLPHNQRSGKLLKRLGFKVEGYAYDYLSIDDRWEDHVLTSLINPNWQKSN
ncbi:MAG: ribosomal protein S5-alanine N-acetyltransferase [Prochloraceae cyanobacterium]|nr:ribosomal protein S5-alanine N-acetyltransferase [Prochloraceae cyanobacterium]